MTNKFLLAIFCCFTFSIINAQLVGNYTIGGNSPDYTSISSAVDDLIALGTAGPVVFNLRNGYYFDSIKINYLPTPSSHNSVTFQSESGDSSTVRLIRNCNNSLFADNSLIYFPNSGSGVDTLILKNITLVDTCAYPFAIYSASNSSFIFDKANIIGSIYFNPLVNNIYNSTIDGFFENNNIYGVGIMLVKNSKFQYTHPPSWISNSIPFNFSRGSFIENIFFGGINFPLYGIGGTVTFLNNTCDSTSVTIYGGSDHSIINNKFYGNYPCDIRISGTSSNQIINLKVINNEIHGNLQLLRCDNSKVYQNKIFRGASLSLSTNNEIFNNFFYPDTILTGFNTQANFYSHGNKIYNNSFSPEVIIRTSDYLGNDYKNNLLPKRLWELYSSNIFNNNNYAGWPVNWDSHPLHIYPNFVDSLTDLHSRNFQLSGKGIYIPLNGVDIDSLSRHNPPSIGANEICFSSNDSINLACGDSVYLSLCSVWNNTNIVWHPNTGLNFQSNNFPKASPQYSTTYVATDTTTGFSDSIKIKVTPYNVEAFTNALIFCGDSILLDATMNAGANFNWSPSYGLSNTNVQRPFAKPTSTTTYTLTATTICGVSSDTIIISVDPLPRAYFNLTSLNNSTATFLNLSTCADNYLWNFGDGDTSTLTNPTHIYLNSGWFTISLLACNNFGCDTVAFNLYVSITGIIETAENNSNIYPNPSTGSFTIRSDKHKLENIKVYNLLGELVNSQQQISTNAITIDLSNHSKGIYFIRIEDENQNVSTKKIVVQ
jgi:hypothetical protein